MAELQESCVSYNNHLKTLHLMLLQKENRDMAFRV